MKTIELLNKCKEKLKISSTYALSKKTGMSEQLLANYYRGRNMPDDYACFKIAEILEIDPAFVIAQIKAESEPNAEKRAYFRSFGGASKKAAVNIVLAVLLSFTFLNVSVTQNDFNAFWRVFFRKRHFA